MPSGLAALLDDVAAITRLAAASVDDVAAAAGKAGAKAAGVVIDDTAVTPQYVTGFTPDRELPIIWRIARGSMKNKLVFLLPAALLLSAFAPWAITPLLMLGGAYLCFEGAEKVLHKLGAGDHGHDDKPVGAIDAEHEQRMVSGAIRTDFILSAEIMAIALAELTTRTTGGLKGATEVATRIPVTGDNIVPLTASLALVAIAVTVGVYGLVAAIVKMDDIGLHLAARPNRSAQAFGRGLVAAMPKLLAVLSIVGTAAMIWVGGGIVLHGLHDYGVHLIPHFIEEVGGGTGFLHWLAEAVYSGLFGLILGGIIAAVVTRFFHKPAPTEVHA